MEATFSEGVPSTQLPVTVASHKARVKLKGEVAVLATLAATSNKTLDIFTYGKPVASFDIPFADCRKLLHFPFSSSNSCKNFAVALSRSNIAVVIDLHSGLVVKNWGNVEDIEVEDELCLGFPQVILTAKGKTRSVITPEYGWEPQSTVDYKEKTGENNEDVAVHSVVNALENQLKSARHEVHTKENQLLLRKSLLNRSLNALSRSVKLQPCNTRAPSYTIRLTGHEKQKNASLNAAMDVSENSLPIKTSGVWEVVDIPTGSWIIGSSFHNTSDQKLTNIRCPLVIKSLDTTYRVSYFLSNTNGDTLSPMSSFSGTLKQGERLFVTAVTSIPDFATEEVELADLFMTCNLSNHSDKLFQCNLGSCQLSFKDLLDESLGFNHSISKQPIPHEHLYGLLSLLSIEEKYSLEPLEKGKLGQCLLHGISKKLELHYDSSLRCYYNFSFYGHVAILVLEENESIVKISIHTSTSRQMKLFVRQLKSYIGVGITLTFTPPNSPTDVTPHELLTAGIDLLSGRRVEEADEPMEITAHSSTGNPQINKIRTAFLKKHNMLMDTSRGHSSRILIPNAVYCKWQDEYFAVEKEC